MANTWLMNTMEQKDHQSDNEDSLSTATSDSMSDCDERSAGVIYEYANYEVIHHQVVDKLEHTVHSVLPQLHGIVSLLEDEDASPQSAKLTSSAELHELQETCARLEMTLSCIIGKGKGMQPTTLTPAGNLSGSQGLTSKVCNFSKVLTVY
ncbi:hypothetical protein JB92DRAFT_3110629 [Gautieria morchelliformis]|nr:hypothetical protein JB92DRAFT_3110629 [Gautieria morchelliformis]